MVESLLGYFKMIKDFFNTIFSLVSGMINGTTGETEVNYNQPIDELLSDLR